MSFFVAVIKENMQFLSRTGINKLLLLLLLLKVKRPRNAFVLKNNSSYENHIFEFWPLRKSPKASATLSENFVYNV